MGVRPSRGRETGGAPTPALIVPGSQSSSYDPWRSISFLSSKLSQRSPRPTKSSARALLVPPIEPRPRPAGHHSVRLLRPPEDSRLRVVLVVPIFGARTVLPRDRGGISHTSDGVAVAVADDAPRRRGIVFFPLAIALCCMAWQPGHKLIKFESSSVPPS